ncbi:MAG TPA: universal stress protein [Dongiaceae bacterium]|nr:universal stress protein [Dongiaceae bacterium]
MLRKILLAHDGSDHADKALDLAVTLARATGCELRILNVVSAGPLTEGELALAETEYRNEVHRGLGDLELLPVGGPQWTGVGTLLETRPELGPTVHRVLGEQIVRQAAAEACAKGADRVTTAVESGDPASVIVSQAREAEADLVVLGSRGLSDLKGLLLGSVSHKVANTAECSVVTVK